MGGLAPLLGSLAEAYKNLDGSWGKRTLTVVLCLLAVARVAHAHFNLSLLRCGDEYGYIFYSFDDLAAGLSGIRAPGFPLVVNAYELIFPHFGFWPEFQVSLWAAAVIWLYCALVDFDVRRLVAFSISAPLFLSGPALSGASYICSDGMAATFLTATVAAFLAARRTKSGFRLTVLAAFVLMTVLIRPAFLPIIPIVAIAWIVVTPFVAEGTAARFGWQSLAVAGLVLVLPLAVFVGARYVLTGHLGLAAFSQFLLAGHTTAYLKDSHLPYFDSEVRGFAATILERRARLDSPCALAPSDNVGTSSAGAWMRPVRLEHRCYGPWYHTAMLAVIEHGSGKLPLADAGGTYTPWPATGSSAQSPPLPKARVGDPDPWSWGGDRWLHEEIFRSRDGKPAAYFDSLLGRYNKVVLEHESGMYLRWIAGETVIASGVIKDYLVRSRAVRWGGVTAMILAVAGLLTIAIRPGRASIYVRALFRRPDVGERVMAVFGICVPALVIGLTITIVYIYVRYVDAPAVFVPSLVGLVNLRLADAWMEALNERLTAG